MIEIPVLSMASLSESEFRERLSKRHPPEAPQFTLHQIVAMDGIKPIPALIVGITCNEGGWAYNLAHFRGYDGATDIRIAVHEKHLSEFVEG